MIGPDLAHALAMSTRGASPRLRALVALKRDPEYREDMQRRVGRVIRMRERIQACKHRVEEHFATQMGMSPEQWRQVEWAHRTGHAAW